MTTLTPKTPNVDRIVSEVRSHVETACGEIASDLTKRGSGFLDAAWKKRIAKAKKAGVRDIAGWAADELFNDPDNLQDLMGDKIHDECSRFFSSAKQRDEHEKLYQAVLDKLSERGHPAMKKACEALRRPNLAKLEEAKAAGPAAMEAYLEGDLPEAE